MTNSKSLVNLNRYYNTPKYLLSPEHPITINVIGCGGTGSHVIMGLTSIHNACIALGHPGLQVTAWDYDIIEEHNVGRQFFSAGEIGMYKSTAIITRVNRMYGLKWENKVSTFKPNRSNIYITCVDSISSRRKIYDMIKMTERSPRESAAFKNMFFWIDAGNSKDTGQIIIGTLKNTEFKLLNFFEHFPDIQDDPGNKVSCSMQEALKKQDLHINKTIALHLNDLLWKMLRTGKVEMAGLYINHKIYQTSAIPV